MVLFDLGVAAPSENNAKKIADEWKQLTNHPSNPLFEKHSLHANYRIYREKWFAHLYLGGVDYFSDDEVKTAFKNIAYTFLKNISLDFDYAAFGYEAHDWIISSDMLKEMLESDIEDFSNKSYSFESIYRGFIINKDIYSLLKNANRFSTFKPDYYWIPY